MSVFKKLEWKVGPPAPRVVTLLWVLVAMSSVIGACAKSLPLSGQPAADAQSPMPFRCRDGGTAPSKGTLTYNLSGPTTGFEPSTLCLAPGGELTLSNFVDRDITVCFSRELPDGEQSEENPFEDGDPRRSIPRGDSHPKLRGDVEGRLYHFRLNTPEGGCTPNTGPGNQGMSGTLEVGTGGPHWPPPKER